MTSIEIYGKQVGLKQFEDDRFVIALIEEIKNKVEETGAFDADAETEEGRKLRKEVAKKLNKTINMVDDAGKDANAAIKKQAAVIDYWRKMFRDPTKELRAKLLAPVNAYTERMEAVEDAIRDINQIVTAVSTVGSVAEVDELLNTLERLSTFNFEDKQEEAEIAFSVSKSVCNDKRVVLEIRENEAKEKAQKDDEERIEKLAQEKAEQILQDETKVEPVERPSDDGLTANRAIVQDLVNLGIDEEQAKNIVRAVRNGTIKNLFIKG